MLVSRRMLIIHSGCNRLVFDWPSNGWPSNRRLEYSVVWFYKFLIMRNEMFGVRSSSIPFWIVVIVSNWIRHENINLYLVPNSRIHMPSCLLSKNARHIRLNYAASFERHKRQSRKNVVVERFHLLRPLSNLKIQINTSLSLIISLWQAICFCIVYFSWHIQGFPIIFNIYT